MGQYQNKKNGKRGKTYQGYGRIPFFFWLSGEGTLKYWNTKAASTHVNKKIPCQK
jgi:hypothetical protein